MANFLYGWWRKTIATVIVFLLPFLIGWIRSYFANDECEIAFGHDSFLLIQNTSRGIYFSTVAPDSNGGGMLPFCAVYAYFIIPLFGSIAYLVLTGPQTSKPDNTTQSNTAV